MNLSFLFSETKIRLSDTLTGFFPLTLSLKGF